MQQSQGISPEAKPHEFTASSPRQLRADADRRLARAPERI
jgi:hypothetical protein